MSSLRNLLCAAAAVGLIFSSSTAEARFGKRSSSSDSDSEKKEKKEKKQDTDDEPKQSSGRVHDATAVDTSERTHDASGVGSRPPPPPPSYEPGPGTVVVVEPPPPVYYVPPSAYVEPAPEVSLRPEKDTVYNPMRLALGGGPLGGGVGIDLMLTFEGEQMGLDGRVLGLALPTDDGSEGSDGITLAGAHLTYALVAQDRVRWRVEGGVTTARAPDISFVGPSVATSFDARLLPTLDFESRLQITPFPYRQIDAQAGLSYEPYPWAIRAGWRALMLDDAGQVDGVTHRDYFNGPFISFGLFL